MTASTYTNTHTMTAHVVGGGSQAAVYAAMRMMDDHHAEMGLSSQLQNQYAKDMGAASMGMAGMIAKMAFGGDAKPEGAQLANNSVVRTQGSGFGHSA